MKGDERKSTIVKRNGKTDSRSIEHEKRIREGMRSTIAEAEIGQIGTGMTASRTSIVAAAGVGIDHGRGIEITGKGEMITQKAAGTRVDVAVIATEIETVVKVIIGEIEETVIDTGAAADMIIK